MKRCHLYMQHSPDTSITASSQESLTRWIKCSRALSLCLPRRRPWMTWTDLDEKFEVLDTHLVTTEG